MIILIGAGLLIWFIARRKGFKPSTFNDTAPGIVFPRKFYVYEFVRLDTQQVVYVGKGSKGRFANPRGRDHNVLRLRAQGNLGVRIIHENIETGREAELIEEAMIKAYISEGYDLYNKIHNPHRR